MADFERINAQKENAKNRPLVLGLALDVRIFLFEQVGHKSYAARNRNHEVGEPRSGMGAGAER